MASATVLLAELKKQGVTDVVSLPDNSSAALLALLREERDIRLHSVTREGEAHALAAGLWIGGRYPLILIQNTGLLESGDSLRALIRMRLPIVCIITFRGYAKMARLGDQAPEFPDVEILSRADLDSVALMTEPTLRAWGVPFSFLHVDQDLPKLSAAFEKARQRSCPVAVLVTQDMT
jgi:sulfopyruvate decarboxylase TPP-binding subunit